MEKEAKNVVVDESQQIQGTVQPTEDSSSKIAENQEPAQNSSPQEDKEYNFSQLRKSKEQLEKRVHELETYMKSLPKAKDSSPPSESKEDFFMEDDDLAEGKHLRKVYGEIKKLHKEMQKEKMSVVPERLRNRFSDFDEVVCAENIEKLKNSEPELYSSIISGENLYSKGIAAYKTLKGLGFVKKDLDSYKEKIEKNKNRPVSAQAIKGQGALSEKNIFAGGLTSELKKQLIKEMRDSIKSHN